MTKSKQIRHSLEYAGVKCALWVAGTLPDAVARGIGALLGSIAFDVLRIRRSVSVDNIRGALGVDVTRATRIARASYRNLGRTLFEFCAFRRLLPEQIRDRFECRGLEHIVAARERGRGAVMFAGHLGHWEMLGAGVAELGYPVKFVVGEQTNKRVDELMNELRRAQGIGIIPRGAALKKVLRALRNNELVALLPDQDARKGGVFIEFLGRTAAAVRGPAIFAVKGGSPIIPVFIRRLPGGRHEGLVEPPLWPDESLEGEEMIVDLTQRANDRLAEHIRRQPEEYFWAHRRWKTQPPEGTG